MMDAVGIMSASSNTKELAPSIGLAKKSIDVGRSISASEQIKIRLWKRMRGVPLGENPEKISSLEAHAELFLSV